jgi:hypothetical protein
MAKHGCHLANVNVQVRRRSKSNHAASRVKTIHVVKKQELAVRATGVLRLPHERIERSWYCIIGLDRKAEDSWFIPLTVGAICQNSLRRRRWILPWPRRGGRYLLYRVIGHQHACLYLFAPLPKKDKKSTNKYKQAFGQVADGPRAATVGYYLTSYSC